MEGDAGTSRLNPTDADDVSGQSDEVSEEVSEDVAAEVPATPEPTSTGQGSGPSRVGRGWLVGIGSALLVLALAVAAGGYLALRSHHDSQGLARDDVAAVAAAKDCVSATQAPDAAAMTASAQKIIDCSTGDFAAQSTLYTGVIAEAYQAGKVQVQVSDMRAAVEKHNDDGSIEVLVAVRVKVSNSTEQDQEVGYRLRLQMAPVDGRYRIAKLDQVSS